jgi:hypothetical protein
VHFGTQRPPGCHSLSELPSYYPGFVTLKRAIHNGERGCAMVLGVLIGALAMAVLSAIPVLGPILAGFIAGLIAGGGL